MTTNNLLEHIQIQLRDYVTEWTTPEENRLDGVLSAEQLPDAVTVLKRIDSLYLIALTGMDDGTEANNLHVLYHFCTGALVVTLCVTLDRIQPVVPSLCAIFPYASPFERETGEMFGITFNNTPDTTRLFLPDDWIEGVYPLRKDAEAGGLSDAT